MGFHVTYKVPRSSRLVLVKDEQEIPLQNICRYYPCKDGGKLVKIMPPLEEGGNIVGLVLTLLGQLFLAIILMILKVTLIMNIILMKLTSC